MTGIDVVAALVIALTAWAGLRRGLVVGVFSLGGLVVGFYVGARVIPSLLAREDVSRWLPLVGLGAALACGAVGQSIGAVAGRALRRTLLVLGPLRALDSIGGGVLGGAIGIALCWAVGAVLLYLPYQTDLRRYAQESAILARLNDELPATRVIDTLAGIDPFAVLAGPAAGVAAPDPAVLETAGVNAAALSVVRVVGEACGLGIEGSGWVAGNGLVVTNAHVVAGVGTPRVDRNDGNLLDASVVSFDKSNDIAVLRVPGLQARSLQLADPEPGTAAGLLGYPNNGPYRETAVRVGRDVTMVGRDAYGAFPTTRRVTTIRGTVKSGNSGGPVVDARGRVITVVFARRAGSDGGYGVPVAAVRAALADAGARALATRCLDR